MNFSPSAAALPGRSPPARRGNRASGSTSPLPIPTWPWWRFKSAARALFGSIANAAGSRTPWQAQAGVIPPADPAASAGEGPVSSRGLFVGRGGFLFKNSGADSLIPASRTGTTAILPNQNDPPIQGVLAWANPVGLKCKRVRMATRFSLVPLFMPTGANRSASKNASDSTTTRNQSRDITIASNRFGSPLTTHTINHEHSHVLE